MYKKWWLFKTFILIIWPLWIKWIILNRDILWWVSFQMKTQVCVSVELLWLEWPSVRRHTKTHHNHCLPLLNCWDWLPYFWQQRQRLDEHCCSDAKRENEELISDFFGSERNKISITMILEPFCTNTSPGRGD